MITKQMANKQISSSTNTHTLDIELNILCYSIDQMHTNKVNVVQLTDCTGTQQYRSPNARTCGRRCAMLGKEVRLKALTNTKKRALHARTSHSTVCNTTVSTKKPRRTLMK